MKQHKFEFAMLDINVGRGTSFDLAATLASHAVPFIFATGYGERVALSQSTGNELVIQKPYERDHLARAVQTVLLSQKA